MSVCTNIYEDDQQTALFKLRHKKQQQQKTTHNQKKNANSLPIHIYVYLSAQNCQLLKVKRKHKVLVNLAKMTLADFGYPV